MKPPPNMVEVIDKAAERLVRGMNTLPPVALGEVEKPAADWDDWPPCAKYAQQWAIGGSELIWRAPCPDDPLGHRLLWLALLRHFAEIGEESP